MKNEQKTETTAAVTAALIATTAVSALFTGAVWWSASEIEKGSENGKTISKGIRKALGK